MSVVERSRGNEPKSKEKRKNTKKEVKANVKKFFYERKTRFSSEKQESGQSKIIARIIPLVMSGVLLFTSVISYAWFSANRKVSGNGAGIGADLPLTFEAQISSFAETSGTQADKYYYSADAQTGANLKTDLGNYSIIEKSKSILYKITFPQAMSGYRITVTLNSSDSAGVEYTEARPHYFLGDNNHPLYITNNDTGKQGDYVHSSGETATPPDYDLGLSSLLYFRWLKTAPQAATDSNGSAALTVTAKPDDVGEAESVFVTKTVGEGPAVTYSMQASISFPELSGDSNDYYLVVGYSGELVMQIMSANIGNSNMYAATGSSGGASGTGGSGETSAFSNIGYYCDFKIELTAVSATEGA